MSGILFIKIVNKKLKENKYYWNNKKKKKIKLMKTAHLNHN